MRNLKKQKKKLKVLKQLHMKSKNISGYHSCQSHLLNISICLAEELSLFALETFKDGSEDALLHVFLGWPNRQPPSSSGFHYMV